MSNHPKVRALLDSTDSSLTRPAADAAGSATTTVVRGSEDAAGLHPVLRAQLRELRLRTGSDVPDLNLLLRLVSDHYQSIDDERRGIVQSMRLMADEARALAREAHEQSSEHLQVILDHIKDVVLTVDADGVIQTFNPTGERVFGYSEAEVVGQRIDLLIPKIAEHETIPQALERLAAACGDTHLDLAGRESWG
ncbi:MAG TPA: PAS domain-containing protein, partial [Steroidobacteraceae bacterium]